LRMRSTEKQPQRPRRTLRRRRLAHLTPKNVLRNEVGAGQRKAVIAPSVTVVFNSPELNLSDLCLNQKLLKSHPSSRR